MTDSPAGGTTPPTPSSTTDALSSGGKKPGGESIVTVLVALAANTLIAVAKTVAAMITGSASMVAEAAHSWADTGNEIFLLIAERRSEKPRDDRHPFGYGREAYVWAMVAAFGLFTAGSILSISHGIGQLGAAEEETNYTVAYVVLAIAFVLEGTSFIQAVRQTRSQARHYGLRPLHFVLSTSETTLRAVFFEDLAALLGILLAAGGIAAHEVTGDAIYDAIGSILVGVLLGVVAILLIVRNGQFLVGQAARPALRRQALDLLLRHPDVDRVTFLHLEWVGPSKLLVVAAVDLSADDRESVLAVRLEALEDRVDDHDLVERCILTLSAPGEADVVA
ncbi:cation diffusion facilitator family transporter [Agilicoccus flavus]|uniref:cation diffusion facilitator family transporter n=1 Tax=Agilicoccus flavus TaxID=2775968 RepID=UPI001CF698F2|nr:cation diffusion facilitator family transporter [Agilicoccus flavus]